MIRNLKVLLAAALALTALGAIAASAHAADEFHCSVAPCRGTLHQDGTKKESHHVFIVENEATTESLSFTCQELTGEGEMAAKTATEITLTNLNYHEATCTVNGAEGVKVLMNGCDYKFFSAGGTTDAANVTVTCPSETVIVIRFNNEKCNATIKGGFTSSGIGYQTAAGRELTATVNHVVIPAATIKLDGKTKENCLINPEQTLIGTYTTGNTLVTGETTAGVMAEAWYE